MFGKIKKVANANIPSNLDLNLIGKINSDIKVSSSVKKRLLFCAAHSSSQPHKDIIAIANKITAKLERNVLVKSNESGLSGLFKRLIEHF